MAAKRKPLKAKSAPITKASPPAKTPRSNGRPTKYDPKYDEEVCAYMAQGYSLTAFAGHIGVGRDSIYEWEKVNPSFSDAIKAARAMRVEKLEQLLLSPGSGIAPAANIFALKNASPAEWRDRSEVEMTGKDGAPMIPIINVTVGDGKPKKRNA